MDEPIPTTSTTGTATSVAPGVTDLLCPFGHIVSETQDRRWLWSAHETLTRTQETTGALPPALAGLREEMGRYLAATCEHHWEVPVDEADLLSGAERCLWCQTPKPKGSWFGDRTARP